MKEIRFRFQNYAWGFNQDESHIISFLNKTYSHFNKGVCDETIPLPDNLLQQICELFAGIYREFPKDEFAWDAPMWTLTIDDKTCTRIASKESDPVYAKVSRIFEAFKAK